jgi:outer membrane murein-binding lipoprotein Lpp
MDPKNNSLWLILAAVIIGGSVLAGSIILNSSLKETSVKLQGIQTSLAETKEELKTLAANRPAAAPKRRGPDPNRRYTINTKGAPAKGVRTAQVEIVEFSDFQ